ncbi:MAG: OmcA/MtrC family decaheme c-type cytochrome [Desulfobacteraceae bacterium]|jgi:OmcA/MtrC family decaheme c-type cytochrome
MNRSLLSYFIVGLILLSINLILSGCGSESGAIVEELAAQSYDENCALCHSAGSIADIETVHSLESNSPVVSISGVREVDLGGGDTRLEVDFKIVDSTNSLIPIPVESSRDVRLALVKLDTTAGGSGKWQSYINSDETKDADTPGTGPDGTYTQATYERGNAGAFNNAAPGEYTYQFSFNMNTVTDPVSGTAITYDRSATHRIAIQFADNVDNASVDFVPNLLPALGAGATRDIIPDSSCNACHIKLGFHGGDRISMNYCVTCHNPGSIDANSGETVDMAVMTHKIHRGESLPAVEAGGEYAIWGHNDSKHDYSAVVFPMDIRNCTRCHDGAADSDNWKNYPNTTVCTSCHDAPGSPDYPGFPALTAQQITEAHQITAQVAAQSIQFNIIDVAVAEGTTGDLDVTIGFSITDPTNADTPYDISDTSTVDLSSLSFLIGWNTSDITNRDAGDTPAQPLRVSIEDATDTGNNIYSMTVSAAIPAEITGSGMVSLQGHPQMDLDGDGEVDNNVPATSVSKSFAITDTEAEDRRSIVDIDKCNECHGFLSLHGGNRNNEIEVCVVCHNADATDLSMRPPDPATTTDGKTEETIDFKYMIHAIHAGQSDLHGFRENGIVLYGYGSREHDYSHVGMPAGTDNLKNCEGCHNSGTYELPINENALPVTVNTGDDVTDPDDDYNITPETAACSSCHDSIEVKTHMASEGGIFDFKPFAAAAGADDDQAELCGPGSAKPAGHVDRSDCCSCHSPR